ncbi:MAG: hypothetical protein J6P62_01230 [Bacteroidales bacterium]|nr:hypothetical protein [Bacteroidales bacterium]
MLFLAANPFKWFVSGGPIGMCGITLFLVALFFAAWKAPAWVKEIGIAGLVFSLIYTLIEFSMAAHFIQGCEDGVGENIIAGGISVGLIPAIYGLIVYFISLIIRIIRKPRI